jgi:hypothetical protein
MFFYHIPVNKIDNSTNLSDILNEISYLFTIKLERCGILVQIFLKKL